IDRGFAINFTTPPGTSTINVQVQTPNGVSNTVQFTYDENGGVPINFTSSDVGSMMLPTQAAWGPDGRLYVGSVIGAINIYTFDDNYNVTNVQSVSAISLLQNNNILGVAFNPFEAGSGEPRLYVAHSFLFAQNGGGCPVGPFPYYGQVSILEGPNFDTVTPLITNLPVSNHDHGINGMTFDNQGDLLIAVGGNTNAGVPHCNIGGLPESPLTGAVLRARITDPLFDGTLSYIETVGGAVNMDQRFGDQVELADPSSVVVHSPGLRNMFDLVFTTGRKLYGVDNGPDVGFGAASTGPTTQGADPESDDEITLLAPDHYFGHPNRNRGRTDSRQNVYQNPLNPLIPGVYSGPIGFLPASTNGVDEYRARTFNSGMRGHLLIQKWNDSLYHATLGNDGHTMVDLSPVAGGTSGLDVLAGPGGVLVGIDHSGNKITVSKPVDPTITSMKALDIFPWRAPAAGGAQFVIGGKFFGTVGDTTVLFGTTAATILSVTPERIVGIIPSEANPTAALIDIHVSSGGQQDMLDRAFRYLLAPKQGVGVWSQLPDMPKVLGETAAGVMNGVLYVVGDHNPETLSYDFVTGAWRDDLAPRPYPGDHHAAEVIDGKWYLFGGIANSSDNKVQIYDPVSDSWSLGANIPYNVGSAATSYINGLVYLSGGVDNIAGHELTQTSVYDPATDSWTVGLAPMPRGRHHTAAATEGTKMYVFGGRNGPNLTTVGFDEVQIYDPASNTWQTSFDVGSTIPPLPLPRSGMGKAAFYRGEFYIIGGETTSAGTGQVAGNVYDRVDVFDPQTQTFRPEAVMTTGKHGVFPVVYNDGIFVAGGGIQAEYSGSDTADEFSR
ncbi:MAG: IPT/TIG domain-containing protein, partial [Bdellovibrionales bacterium]|nr:IPT/TIG domain-containing protein [Bdellovibrionales bacterium]